MHKRSFFPKMAVINIKNNGKFYIPYLLTCVFSVAMFYIMIFIKTNKGIKDMPGADSLETIMGLGGVVIGLFAAIVLFYTNSFLMKRRKKELGLYNILGMEKRHIAVIMLYETLITGLGSIICGLLAGVLFSKLAFVLLYRILNFSIPLGFTVSVTGIYYTVCLFAVIFILIFISNLWQIKVSNPITLLQGGHVGQKEPKSKFILAITGVMALAGGYTIALTTKSPLDAIFLFFLAVILVIIGTYCIFTAGSIVGLKLLRKNKKYYYQTKHFTSVSGMIYRMKQNAVGLANICVLSTMVLVILSTTVSFYVGMEDVLRTRFSRNIAISAENVTEEQVQTIDNIISDESKKLNISPENVLHYRLKRLYMIQNENTFKESGNGLVISDGQCEVVMLPLSEYNRIMNDNKTMENNEVLIYRMSGKLEGDSVDICGSNFKIKEMLNDLDVDKSMGIYFARSYYMVFNNTETIQALINNIDSAEKIGSGISYYYGFDVNGSSQTQIDLYKTISIRLIDTGYDFYSESAEASRESFYSFYGGLLFLGIFLGAMFITATVLIIYYKQISEGYDDKERFEIMQKVGMSRDEVKRSVRSQVLTVFFLPLVTAGIHIAFAFKVINKLMVLLNLNNINLFILCTVGVFIIFGLFYAGVYALTAKVYYKIVS